MNLKQQIYNAGIYCRLSVDDPNVSESGSIQTQRAMLTDYCKQNGLNVVDYYIDDGVSGTSFQRPGFQQMIADIEAGRINTVVTKDLSRFGRNYAEAGMYLDHFFVERDIRFIAAQDGVDTLRKGFDISVPMRNIINDFYARDVSQKTKAAKESRAKQGMFLGSKAPYGYVKDHNNRHRLVVDDEAAEIVRRIFRMASEGAGYNKIARTLRADSVPNPISYHKQKHPDYDAQGHFEMQYQWHVTSVQKILENPAYLGCLAHGKVGTKGIKGKRVRKDQDEWIVVNDTHEPIVDMETWTLVRSHLSQKRRERKTGETQMFAGLLYCSDCGSALSFSSVKRKTKPDGGQYKCWYYMRHGKEYCTAHYISLDQITELVLTDIRKHARFAAKYEKQYLERLRDAAAEKEVQNLKRETKEAERMKKRIVALDEIIKKLIEKNALGKIPDERFYTLSAEYEQEQRDLKKRMADFESHIQKAKDDAQNAERFAKLIHKYTDIQELNSKILHELIHRIVVHEKTVDEDGNPVRLLEIFYNFMGIVQLDI